MVRDVSGALVANQIVAIQFLIHQTSATGPVTYSETHSSTTNKFGLLNVSIGSGNPVLGTFSAIDWSTGSYFTETQVDITGGTNYISMGAQQMLSVPYALFAAGVDDVDDADADPTNEIELPTGASEGDALYWCNGAAHWGPCPTCSDSIQNGDETGVECGGSSCNACPSICNGADTLIDARDGQVYNTVQIGNQCWMAENLNYGTMVNSNYTGTNHSDQTNNGTAEKYCYDNYASNCAIYGGLYEWDEMMQYAASSKSNPSGVQGICPTGWHVPSDAEWTELENYLIANGYNYDGTTTGNKYAKSMASTTGWNTSSTIGEIGNNQSTNNSSGFTALPGGTRSSHGFFNYLGNLGYFWSASESSASYAWFRYLLYNSSQVNRGNNNKQDGFSCRCVRD